jgi:transposase-like protein
MPRKGFRPGEIIAKLRQADVLLGQGKKVAEVVKALGVSEVTYYRWRQEHGGMSVSQAKRLKELERENARLRKAVADLTLDKLILQEAGRGNRAAPSAAGPRSSGLSRRSGFPRGGPVEPLASTARCSAMRPSGARTRTRSPLRSSRSRARTGGTATGGSPPCCEPRAGG